MKNKKIKSSKAKPSLLPSILFTVVLVSLCSLIFIVTSVYQTLYGTIIQPQKMIEVKKGENYYNIVSSWNKEVPLFSKIFAKIYIKTQIKKPLQIGSYQAPKNPNFVQMMHVLQQRDVNSTMVRVKIIEGKAVKDLYQNLQQDENIRKEVVNLRIDKQYEALNLGATTPEGEFRYNLEGWFAPNTYLYAKGTSDKKILTDLYQRQKKILDEAWKNRADDLPYKSAYEALIMASIIEKETGLAKERGLVAGVFVNRLNKGMKLQTDPTIIYGMGQRYNGDIRKKDIKEYTPYNTYQIDGLPPTPISLPSKESIEAALNPTETEALFFVATGHGGHKFSKNYDEHKKAITEYLDVMKSKK